MSIRIIARCPAPPGGGKKEQNFSSAGCVMSDLQRKRISIEGIVQGVGFRPFVYQAARKWGVAGWVRNDSRGVTVEAERACDPLQ